MLRTRCRGPTGSPRTTKHISSLTCGFSMLKQMALIGRKSLRLSCTVILWPNLSAPAIVGKII